MKFPDHTETEIAAACGLGRTAVVMWKRVPAAHVLTVERLTGISRHVLRPDVFGPAAKDMEAGAPE